MELQFADEPGKYDCSTCPAKVAKLRRCEEHRDDFGTQPGDPAFFPIHLRKDDKGQPAGPAFGFCPGKATWYSHVQKLFRQLILAAETGNLFYEGGLAQQPYWVADLLGWFVVDYKDHQFAKRMRAIFGGTKKAEVTPPKK